MAIGPIAAKPPVLAEASCSAANIAGSAAAVKPARRLMLPLLMIAYVRCAENATAQKHCCIEHATGAGEGRCLRNEVREVGAGLVEIDLLSGW